MGGILIVVGLILLFVHPLAGIVAICLGVVFAIVGSFKKDLTRAVSLQKAEQSLESEMHSLDLAEGEKKVGVFKFLKLTVEGGRPVFGIFLLTSKRLVFRSMRTTQWGREQGALNVTLHLDRLRNIAAGRTISFLHDGTNYKISRGLRAASMEELGKAIQRSVGRNQSEAEFAQETVPDLVTPTNSFSQAVESQAEVTSEGNGLPMSSEPIGLIGRMPLWLFVFAVVISSAMGAFVLIVLTAIVVAIFDLDADRTFPWALSASLAGLVLAPLWLIRFRKRQRFGKTGRGEVAQVAR